MSEKTEKTVVVIGMNILSDYQISSGFSLLDAETGSAAEYVQEVSPKAKVEEIQTVLGQNDVPFFFYNRCTSVDDQDLIGEAFDSEDAVTVWVGAPPTPEDEEEEEEEEEEERGELKNIKNNSDYEIIVVTQTKQGRPIFFEGNQLKAVKFDSWTWTKIIELYRYLYNTINGGKFYLIFINLILN